MTGVIGFIVFMKVIEDNMPWYDKYFYQIFFSTVALILLGSAVQLRSTLKSTKKPVTIQKQYKDTAK